MGAFSAMSLHDKCALSLGVLRDPELQCDLDNSTDLATEWIPPDVSTDLGSHISSSTSWFPSSTRARLCDMRSVIADDEVGKHKLVAAMELMDPEELQCLKEEAIVIQHNVRAWLLKRNYYRMRDTTQKLHEVAKSIEIERRDQSRCKVKSDASFPLSNSSEIARLERAAVTVQAATRSMIARKNFLQAKNVTIKVQAATRGTLCRKNFSRMKRQALASLVIQRNVREWWNKQSIPSP